MQKRMTDREKMFRAEGIVKEFAATVQGVN
jgi:hypothetical protein